MASAGGGRKVAGATNFKRKTWDVEEYAQRAKERAESSAALEAAPPARGGGGAGGAGEAGAPAPYRDGPDGLARPEGSARAFVQARSYELKLDSRVNKRRLVTDATPTSQVGGFWCELCQCTLRDSSTYLDHINGIKHQRRMGFSMRVEESSIDAVKAKLARVKEEQAGAAAREAAEGTSHTSFALMDDAWGDDADWDLRRARSDRANVEALHATSGFREGHAVGVASPEHLQAGFAAGYAAAAAPARVLGLLRGVVGALAALAAQRARGGTPAEGDAALTAPPAAELRERLAVLGADIAGGAAEGSTLVEGAMPPPSIGDSSSPSEGCCGGGGSGGTGSGCCSGTIDVEDPAVSCVLCRLRRDLDIVVEYVTASAAHAMGSGGGGGWGELLSQLAVSRTQLAHERCTSIC